MAVNEISGFLKYKGTDGNTYLLMPITTKDSVDGIDEIEAELANTVKFTAQTLTDEQKNQVKENLGISSGSVGHFARSVTLSVNGWVDNEQTVSIAGVLEDAERCTVITGSDWSSAGVYDICGVCCIAQGDNSLTFQCTYVPDEDLTVNVTVLI